MSRQPWDDLGDKARNKKKNTPAMPAIMQPPPGVMTEEEIQQRNKEIMQNRMLFGAITGSLTGGAFGFIDSIRKTKIRSLDGSAVNKTGIIVARSSVIFGSFYTFYQGSRRALELYAPKPYAENGMLIAACLSVTPFVASAAIRPLMPYAVLLIGLDVWNTVMSPDDSSMTSSKSSTSNDGSK